MTVQRIARGRDGRVQVYVPHLNRCGEFVLARPHAGNFRNRAFNQVLVNTIGEVLRLLAAGFSLRMWRGRGSNVLISSRSIEVMTS